MDHDTIWGNFLDPREKTLFLGIQNTSSYCYVISILQLLLHVDEFKLAIIKNTHEEHQQIANFFHKYNNKRTTKYISVLELIDNWDEFHELFHGQSSVFEALHFMIESNPKYFESFMFQIKYENDALTHDFQKNCIFNCRIHQIGTYISLQDLINQNLTEEEGTLRIMNSNFLVGIDRSGNDQNIVDDTPIKINKYIILEGIHYELRSFICFFATSRTSGHYITFINLFGSWVLFNDQDVSIGLQHCDIDFIEKSTVIYNYHKIKPFEINSEEIYVNQDDLVFIADRFYRTLQESRVITSFNPKNKKLYDITQILDNQFVYDPKLLFDLKNSSSNDEIIYLSQKFIGLDGQIKVPAAGIPLMPSQIQINRKHKLIIDYLNATTEILKQYKMTYKQGDINSADTALKLNISTQNEDVEKCKLLAIIIIDYIKSQIENDKFNITEFNEEIQRILSSNGVMIENQEDIDEDAFFEQNGAFYDWKARYKQNSVVVDAIKNMQDTDSLSYNELSKTQKGNRIKQMIVRELKHVLDDPQYSECSEREISKITYNRVEELMKRVDVNFTMPFKQSTVIQFINRMKANDA